LTFKRPPGNDLGAVPFCNVDKDMDGALFPLGRIVATPGALKTASQELIVACIRRHVNGDWGELDADDKRTNDEAVYGGLRILSAYPIDPQQPCAGYGDNTLWIITEADRSVTTALLPHEY
jgi:hypothetical protein